MRRTSAYSRYALTIALLIGAWSEALGAHGVSGKDAVFLINLRPTRLRGALSQGMILAAEVEDFDELRAAQRVWVVNSVRRWRDAVVADAA